MSTDYDKYKDFNHRLSHSQFKTYRECPRKWQHKYKEGMYPPSFSEHFIFGTAVHEAIQSYLKCLYGEGNLLDFDIHKEFKSHLKSEFDSDKSDFESSASEGEFPIDKKRMVEMYYEGVDMLDNFLAERSKFFDPSVEDLAGIEYMLLEPTEGNNNVAWYGFIDVLIKTHRGKYRVIDIKTSTKGWGKYKKKDRKITDQLQAYKHYLIRDLVSDGEQIDPSDVEVEYIVLAKDKVKTKKWVEAIEPPGDSDAVAQLINDFVAEAFEADGTIKEDKGFDKNPDRWTCCFCPFSKDFGDEGFKVCDHKRFDDYPESMRPYVPDEFVK